MQFQWLCSVHGCPKGAKKSQYRHNDIEILKGNVIAIVDLAWERKTLSKSSAFTFAGKLLLAHEAIIGSRAKLHGCMALRHYSDDCWSMGGRDECCHCYLPSMSPWHGPTPFDPFIQYISCPCQPTHYHGLLIYVLVALPLYLWH